MIIISYWSTSFDEKTPSEFLVMPNNECSLIDELQYLTYIPCHTFDHPLSLSKIDSFC